MDDKIVKDLKKSLDKRFDLVDDKFDSLVKLLYDQANQFNQRMDILEQKIDSRVDDVFTKMDAVYGEVIAMRQEQSMHSVSHARLMKHFKITIKD